MNTLFKDVDGDKYPYIYEIMNSNNEIDKYYTFNCSRSEKNRIKRYNLS